jgi:hypothetical protein
LEVKSSGSKVDDGRQPPRVHREEGFDFGVVHPAMVAVVGAAVT